MAKKQADGRYRTKVTVGRYPDGKPIYKYASGKTKKELAAAVEEIKRKYIGGVAINRETLAGDFVVEWFTLYKKGKVSPATEIKYKQAINGYILPAIASKQMRAITSNDLQQLLNQLAGRSRTTITQVYGVICNVFRLAYSQGIVDRDPTRALIKPESVVFVERRSLTEAETKAFLSVAQREKYGRLMMLLYYTGVRLGEALGLQYGDIDYNARTLHIQRDLDWAVGGKPGALKTPAADRLVPIPDTLLPWIEKPKHAPSDGYVITSNTTHSALSLTGFNKIWRRLMREVWLADPTIEARDANAAQKAKGQKTEPYMISIITPHYLRHNYASVLYNAGVDVMAAQKWLGHTDPTTTLKIYSHLSDQNTVINADKLNKIF